jgi:16S rRNA G527 N7-methylase RsmG
VEALLEVAVCLDDVLEGDRLVDLGSGGGAVRFEAG